MEGFFGVQTLYFRILYKSVVSISPLLLFRVSVYHFSNSHPFHLAAGCFLGFRRVLRRTARFTPLISLFFRFASFFLAYSPMIPSFFCFYDFQNRLSRFLCPKIGYSKPYGIHSKSFFIFVNDHCIVCFSNFTPFFLSHFCSFFLFLIKSRLFLFILTIFNRHSKIEVP